MFVCAFLVQVKGESGVRDVRQTLQSLQEQNQLRSDPLSPRRHKRRWSHLRSDATLPKPMPEEQPFVLDLKNFPDLAKDLDSQNPNIQVRRRDSYPLVILFEFSRMDPDVQMLTITIKTVSLSECRYDAFMHITMIFLCIFQLESKTSQMTDEISCLSRQYFQPL